MAERNATSDLGMCPMAAMCKGMTGKSSSGLLLKIPGIALLGGGVLILIEPMVLPWLMGGTSMLIGIVVLVLTSYIRKAGAGMGDAHS